MNTVRRTDGYRKYQSPNPVVRWLIERFFARITAQIEALQPARIIDLGCGEGLVAMRLMDGLQGIDYVGIDVSEEMLGMARSNCPGSTFIRGDLLQMDIESTSSDMLLCLEVLEHLPRPQALLSRLASLPQKGAIFSVPWEPFFRLGSLLRGNYVRRLGNHPGHVQQFGRRAFAELLSAYYPRLEVQTCFPWIFASARPG
ncbi:MAG: class I SAM-dependent methyltransferase [Deltaproteobacteria bacterium]|nr:class I SAM-dependent methyltransferase [Deltaproteobacteria bacterium]